MLRLFAQKNYQSEDAEDNLEGSSSEDNCEEDFCDFDGSVSNEDKQMAMEIMKKMYDGKSGVKVVWLTLFFIEIGWLTEPSPAAIIDTFNVKKFSKHHTLWGQQQPVRKLSEGQQLDVYIGIWLTKRHRNFFR